MKEFAVRPASAFAMSFVMTAYQKLEKVFSRRARLGHLQSVAGWDASAMMPKGGAEARGAALAEAAVMQVEMMAQPELKDYFGEAETQTDLNDWQKANLREMKRVWTGANAVDADLVERKSIACSKSEMAWRDLRGQNNWKDFMPLQKEVFELTLEEAEQRSSRMGLSKYDSMIDIYDPGMRAEEIEKVFGELREKLPPLAQKIIEKQKSESVVAADETFSTEKQAELNKEIMNFLGFDFNHGRLDTSTHPFCGGTPTDIRMTTRYTNEEFLTSMASTVHETGHGSYEQGLPRDWLEQPVGRARGMAIHESQSLLFENLVSLSKEFFDYASPIIRKNFGDKKDDGFWSTDNLYRTATRVQPNNLIRVDADEVTYPMHVILRFEIEKALFSGDLKIEDLPDAWNAKTKELLNLDTTGNFKDGCMQDVHWPDGAFGYFPSYTLGAINATQFFASARKTNPEILSEISKGNIQPLKTWLKENVWSKGSYFGNSELLKEATGSTLQSHFFLNHLESRYLG